MKRENRKEIGGKHLLHRVFYCWFRHSASLRRCSPGSAGAVSLEKPLRSIEHSPGDRSLDRLEAPLHRGKPLLALARLSHEAVQFATRARELLVPGLDFAFQP